MQVIDKSNPMPYYEQLAELLRHEISEQDASGQPYQLPSEHDLANWNGISRATVRHALDVLERDGLIYREKGKGSFAAVRRVEHELTRLVSTTEDMRQRGWSLRTRLVSIETVPAPTYIAHALEIMEHAPLYKLCRLRVIDEGPLALQTAYISSALCPDLEEYDLTSSLYQLLETRYSLRLWTGQEILRAQPPTPREADLLQISEESPVMYIERITYAVTGVPVEYLESVWRGDRYDFKVALSRP